jgi:nucleotide-binding universal stress UspA family protein
MPEKRSGGIGAAVDFSPASEAAARYAADLARARKAPLHVIHVLEVLPPIIPGTETFFAEDLDRAIAKDRRREKAQLAALVRRIRAGRVKVSAVWREGRPATEIVKAAEELGFAVILMGTRRRSELEKAVLGSVATEVVRHAPCPVLTVREK